jgi:plasmid stabilization system protein ParE
MKSLPVDVHPEAVAEAQAATQWYRERSPSAADAFLAELDRAIEKIAENPRIWPRYVASTQRFLLKRFPFSVVFRLTPKQCRSRSDRPWQTKTWVLERTFGLSARHNDVRIISWTGIFE